MGIYPNTIYCLGSEGLVIMDFPQAVNVANNNSAFSLFKRNIDNVTAYLGRFHLSSRIQTMEQKSGRTIRAVNCILLSKSRQHGSDISKKDGPVHIQNAKKSL